jgi:hypothetical protein
VHILLLVLLLVLLLLLPVPRVPPLAADLPRHVVMVVVEVVAEGWVPAWPIGLQHFSLCRNISADVHELARRQRETDDNLRRQASTMGMPFAPRSPDVPLHLPPPEINEWHQQAYGVPFMSADDEEEEEAYFDNRKQFAPPPYQGDPGQSSSHPPPQDPSGSAPPQISLGKNTLRLTWRIIYLLRISLLLTGDLWIGGSLLFWFLLPKRGRRFLLLAVPFYLCNEHRFVIIIISLSRDACDDGLEAINFLNDVM